MFLSSNEPLINAQDDAGYNPVARALGIAALGTAAYQAHRYKLATDPGYAQRLYNLSSRFEELSPDRIGRTFGLSERFSSHLINSVQIPFTQLVGEGRLTPLGAHLDRLIGGQVDIAKAGSGLAFRRTSAADPYLRLVGRDDVAVRFTSSGRLGGSSFRYGADLRPHALDLDFSGRWWEPRRLRDNFQQLRQSQIPRGYKSWLHASDQAGPFWFTDIQPYQARTGLGQAGADALHSYRARTGRFLFEMAERPQRLLADVGFGLRAGSYNKIFHVPFRGEGGLVNGLLFKRVLPIALAATGLGYLDYLTGHAASNAVVGLPLQANVLRADVTDKLPGARRLTNFYADVVPGPQYGPLALPLAGAFAGGLYHYAHVLKGTKDGHTYAGEIREIGAAFLPKEAGGALGFLKQPRKLLDIFRREGMYPGKGLLLGLAAMLPFIPGMLGSRRTGKELRDVYSGKEPVAVRSGRWWDLGTSPYGGGRIKEYRPHWYQLFKSRAEIKSLYGSEQEYWAHNPVLHPLRFLRDPYFLEKRHYQDRPYPVSSPAFSNVPLVGPLLAATVGKVIKPEVRMHQDVFSGEHYSLYSTRLEPGDRGLPPPQPGDEFSLPNALKRELRQFEEFIGLPGFLFHSARTAVFPGDDLGKEVFFQGSRQMDNLSRRYYERELGAGLGPNPVHGSAPFGYSEPLRRFIQREEGIAQANEIPNTMPSWLPGDDYFINFKVGDPYVKLADGFARLPGEGYSALHPELEGVAAEDYPEMSKLSILGDVAPYSRQYASLRATLERSTRDHTEDRIAYEKIVDRVQQMKDSVIQVDERRFSGETEEASGTIARADLGGIELEEYPGRTFHLSSLGYSAADLSALALGGHNASRSQIAQEVDSKRASLQRYFADRLSPGTPVQVIVPRGSLEHAPDIRAVLVSGKRNINNDLIASDLALYRKDRGGAEAGSMHSALGRAVGALAEGLSFTGDEDTANPLRYVPTPGHTKLWQERTVLSQYVQQEVVGTRMRRWDHPLHDFLGPYFRGMVRRLTGRNTIPDDVRHRRDLNSLADILSYLRDLRGVASHPEAAGRYTNQARRTATGTNLFNSPIFVASTLPDRDAIYFRRFLQETDPDRRQEILELAPPEMARALSAQWAARDAAIQMAEGGHPPPLEDQGRQVTAEGQEEYQQAGTKLGYGDYMRSREIAEFFARTGFHMPEGEDSALWDEAVDYQDVKLKLLRNEGYDMHDFNLFEDRAALLWRKPWLDGAVRELTSGNGRSVENLRQSVEQIMLAAGDRNPNVRAAGQASHRALGSVRMDVEVDDDARLLREARRNPEELDVQ